MPPTLLKKYHWFKQISWFQLYHRVVSSINGSKSSRPPNHIFGFPFHEVQRSLATNENQTGVVIRIRCVSLGREFNVDFKGIVWQLEMSHLIGIVPGERLTLSYNWWHRISVVFYLDYRNFVYLLLTILCNLYMYSYFGLYFTKNYNLNELWYLGHKYQSGS